MRFGSTQPRTRKFRKPPIEVVESRELGASRARRRRANQVEQLASATRGRVLADFEAGRLAPLLDATQTKRTTRVVETPPLGSTRFLAVVLRNSDGRVGGKEEMGTAVNGWGRRAVKNEEVQDDHRAVDGVDRGLCGVARRAGWLPSLGHGDGCRRPGAGAGRAGLPPGTNMNDFNIPVTSRQMFWLRLDQFLMKFWFVILALLLVLSFGLAMLLPGTKVDRSVAAPHGESRQDDDQWECRRRIEVWRPPGLSGRQVPATRDGVTGANPWSKTSSRERATASEDRWQTGCAIRGVPPVRRMTIMHADGQKQIDRYLL